MPLRLVNLSAFAPGLKIGMRRPGEYRLTVLLKASFRLEPGGVAVPLESQAFPTGDIPYPDDEEGKGAPRYASDFAPFKPKADILLVGTCHPPRPVDHCNVTLQVGSWSKTLVVSGTRAWRPSTFGQKPTDPAVFDSLELRYEHAFGGKDYERNPVGMGLDERETPGGKNYVPVPHIEDPKDRVKSRRSKPEPAGFGPLPLEWPQRMSKAGSYKGDYEKERWPNYAKDMDWTLMNAAPEDQQVEYLNGDEALTLKNLNARHAVLTTKLPGLRARCLRHDHPERTTGVEWSEVPLRTDTLWIDADAGTLVLVWRGVTQVSAVNAPEVDALVFAVEPLDAPLAEETLREALAERPAEPEEPSPPLIDPETEAAVAEAEAAAAAAFAAAGFDPKNAGEPDEESKKLEAELLEKHAEHLPAAPLTREQVAERLKAGEPLAGEDLSNLDLAGLPFAGANLEGVNLSLAQLADTDFTGANLNGAILDGANCAGARFVEANLNGAEGAGIILTGASVERAHLEGASFLRAKAERLNAVGAMGGESVWEDADLREARFMESTFPAAVFLRAQFTGTDFSGADFSNAVVEDAQGDAVVMRRMVAPGLRASRARFPGANCKELNAPGSGWDEAQLEGADFSFSRLAAADFADADLDKANLSGVSAREASLVRTKLREANLLKSDFLGSCLEGANLNRADCRGSNFFESEFLEASVSGTRFELANLKMTKLDA